MRLSSNRCFYGEPKTYDGRGRPRKHGHKLKLNDPQTWLNEDEIVELEDPKLGRIKIQAWHKFHFRQAASQKLSLIRVEQLDSRHRTLPNLGTKEQCDRWSDLMPMMTRELWLARNIIIDHPLPRQKPQVNLTPGRVAQSFGMVQKS